MSNIRAGTISGVNGTDPVTLTKQSAAKCWVNFNGSSFGINASFNTSSMTDLDVGVYQINFTSNMVANSYTTNWNVNGSYSDAISLVIGYGGIGAPATGANGAGIKSQNTSGIRGDNTENAISIHGDLA